MLLKLEKILRNVKLKPLQKLRFSSKQQNANESAIGKLRNLGILAHIDAGKTTTTERMLFYSGMINHMGEVHHGNTVTDYMDQERERGITITSAAVTFNWNGHQINLIDTPGHIDFTMEVEQTLNVLDGAIVVLDSSAGVEAQTLTVWRQADRYHIPRIVFANKMDRFDASLEMCCKSIETKLDVMPLCVQIPIINNCKLVGLVDLLTMTKLTWDPNSKQKQMTTSEMTEKLDEELWLQAKAKREHLIDKLSDFNDKLANKVITLDSFDKVEAKDIQIALREVTLSQKAVLVLCGSSYKNIGVQPLMNAVVLYLPSPADRNEHYSTFEDDLCAKAFKVIHDKQRGPLVFFRLYSGKIEKSQKLYNVQQDLSEQMGRLYAAYADDFKEVDALENGSIAVATGLKKTVSGDLISNSATSFQKAKKKLSKNLNIPEEEIENKLGLVAKIPEPVFFCSIEPPSLVSQSALDQALLELQREDPSLRVTHDTETSQTILAGMGELHLDIIKDRIKKEYKIDAELGPLQIAYRETPLQQTKVNHTMETKVGNTKHLVSVALSIIPSNQDTGIKGVLRLDKTPEGASNIASIIPKHLLAVRQGIEVALAHGPKIGLQVINAQVMLHYLEVGKGTSESMISAAVTQCVQKLLNESTTNILEPIMYLEIVSPEDYSSSIMADLTRRRAEIQNVTVRGKNKVILCDVPLADLLGYSTTLRTISSGTATFTMEFVEYRKMSSVDELKAIENVRGF